MFDLPKVEWRRCTTKGPSTWESWIYDLGDYQNIQIVKRESLRRDHDKSGETLDVWRIHYHVPRMGTEDVPITVPFEDVKVIALTSYRFNGGKFEDKDV